MSEGLINLWLPEPDLVLHQALGKALEECNELGAALARCIIQGFFESEPVTEKHNRDHLREEIADVVAVLDWLIEIRPDLETRGSQRYLRKLNGFRKWQEKLETHRQHAPDATDERMVTIHKARSVGFSEAIDPISMIRGNDVASAGAAQLRRIRELEEALLPFAAFCEKAERFVQARAEQGGSSILPVSDFRLKHFRAARSALRAHEVPPHG